MIWIIGNRGMLGQELAEQLAARGIANVGSDREVSILDPEALRHFAQGVQKDTPIKAIVNCAAYTAVDRAEDEAELAHALNAEGPGNIAELARSVGARFLHISTDYVFSGAASQPYREDDPIGPTGVYGRTKAEGETRVREACPDAVIIRTAWLYGKYGPNFVATMLRLMRERTELGVVADQRGTPTWARDLALGNHRRAHCPTNGSRASTTTPMKARPPGTNSPAKSMRRAGRAAFCRMRSLFAPSPPTSIPPRRSGLPIQCFRKRK